MIKLSLQVSFIVVSQYARLRCLSDGNHKQSDESVADWESNGELNCDVQLSDADDSKDTTMPILLAMDDGA